LTQKWNREEPERKLGKKKKHRVGRGEILSHTRLIHRIASRKGEGEAGKGT